jgi:PAS domain S-box-containing protein
VSLLLAFRRLLERIEAGEDTQGGIRAPLGREGPDDADEAAKALKLQVRLLDLANDAIIVRDTRDIVVYWNRGAERLYGYSRSEALGQYVHSLLQTRFSHPFQAIRDTFFREGKWEGVVTHLRRDGTPIQVESRWTLEKDPEGLPVASLEITRDTSERQALEDQLRQAQKMEAVGRLAGGIAHDFNNILTAILGYAELLTGEIGEEEIARHDLEEIRKAAERAAGLTRQLLAFSRKQVLEPRVLEVNTVMASMDKMLRRLIGASVELVMALDPELGKIKADPGQLEQVLLNLAINARDAMLEGGTLTIETRNVELGGDEAFGGVAVVPGSYVMLSVRDTGAGMDAGTRERLFEPFFTTKEEGKGTGLGLATVYGIVKQSGGYIRVDSEPGAGSTFRVYLPRVPDPADADLGGVEASALPGSETILLAEDEDAVRAFARRVLERSGYTVLEARSGEEALLMAEQHAGSIHLLLTDVVMPGINGPKLAELLHASRPQVRVLYVTGYTENAVVHRGLLDNDLAFMQKPFTVESLTRRVRRILEHPPDSRSAELDAG